MNEDNAARAVVVQIGTRRNVENHRQRKRQRVRIFQEKKRRLVEKELEELEHRYQETRKFYQKLNASHKGFVLQAEMCRDKDGGILTDNREMIKRWNQHFDEHLNGAHAGDQDGGGRYIAGVDNDAEEPLPTMSEVKEAIRQLNSNKSAGKDGIAAELIKMGPDKFSDFLHRLMVRIWDIEQLPGDKLDCANYRTIAVLNVAYKVLSRIVFYGGTVNDEPDLHITANPPKMPRTPSPYAPPIHRLQNRIRHDRP
ncbi:uncharacterized protein LOC129739401 [Uranotaenia lowii]|uniref:uncharacterized protein LOC129739401 n=1 Tax=Uranotaenia lowii TaxID=190385 RepID=UPI00247A26FD|nr:uncharacterized protein LOC129739401 [Uranotaenia lowii]